MKKIFSVLALAVLAYESYAQVVNTAIMDTTNFNYNGKVIVNGYVDTYYGYDFNDPPTHTRPYFVSMARHNEFAINLAYVDVKYGSSRMRARFVPGFGSYINANYAAEPGVLKNIVEASVGVRLFPNKNIWLDAGVLGSPYTNESAISKDHLMYTRSFAPENVPYYLSGVKLTVPIKAKWNVYVYLVNGWQQIEDQNNGKSLGTQLEYRPTNHLLLNWNTYVGNEQTLLAPQNRMRYLSDFFFIYSKGKWSATGSAYIGQQQQVMTGVNTSARWWQANIIGKYSFTDKFSLAGRIEYFDDPDEVMIKSITNAGRFSSYSTGLCFNIQIATNVVARFEGRTFFSDREVYLRNGSAVKESNMLISNLTVLF